MPLQFMGKRKEAVTAEAIPSMDMKTIKVLRRFQRNHLFDPPRLFDQLIANLADERLSDTHAEIKEPEKAPYSEHFRSRAYPGPPWKNPTQLDQPSFLMNFPFSYATDISNNAWMQDLTKEERKPDHRQAARQFLEVYRSLAAEALVYLIPTPSDISVQDLVFTANLGVVLTHLPDQNTVLISNFSSPARQPETHLGECFFKSMGYDVYLPPSRFEGEAEFLHLHDNIYAGGYGIRSEPEAYDWMERNFDMHIIRIREKEPYLCNLQCMVFPITRHDTLACVEIMTREEIAQLETVTHVIPVSLDEALSGICNSVRLPTKVLTASDLEELKPGTEDYCVEKNKNRRLEEIAGTLGLEVVFFNLSEFLKSGARLSCLVMHLNRNGCTLP